MPFGVAILALTVVVKILLFPLANQAFASMSKMKALQPKINDIKERFADDQAKQRSRKPWRCISARRSTRSRAVCRC